MVAGIIASIAGSVLSGLVSKAFESATTGSGSSSSSASSSSTQNLDKDDFLKLLTVQLRNQDPLNPISNTDFIAQTAQFTSLEQLTNMNQSLNQLLAQNGNTVTGGAALLGRTVTVNGTAIQLDGTSGGTLAYRLPAGAAAVAIQVQDATGTPVRTLLLGQQGAGTHQLAFDGLDDDGRRLPAGTYRYQVRGVDAAGGLIPGVVTGGGQVTGLNVENGQLILLLGQERVPLSSVVSVLTAAAQ